MSSNRPTEKELPVPDWPPTRIGGCDFRRWRDGDLEVDLDPDAREGWKGHYFTEAEARTIRDFLNKAFP